MPTEFQVSYLTVPHVSSIYRDPQAITRVFSLLGKIFISWHEIFSSEFSKRQQTKENGFAGQVRDQLQKGCPTILEAVYVIQQYNPQYKSKQQCSQHSVSWSYWVESIWKSAGVVLVVQMMFQRKQRLSLVKTRKTR